MQATAFVYILTNEHHTTFYVGVTSDLRTRLWEHQTKQNGRSFTARYNLTKLIYFEGHPSIVDAIAREKELKGRSRSYKNALVTGMNPEWKDLTESVFIA